MARLSFLRPFWVLALLAARCQDYRFEQKCPEGITETQVSRVASEPTPADILFVVDNSGSMADEQEKLAANFDMFINQIAGPANDYRIAVVSTDQSFADEQGGLRENRFAPDPPFELERADSQACTGVGIPKGCFRGPDANRRVISTRDLSRQEQIDAFKNNVRVGSCGSGDEEGIEAMLDALQKAQQAGSCNSGFLRENANLVIVFVSDEDDHGEVSVSVAADRLAQLKDPRQIRVAAIVGFADGQASNCSTQGGSACGGYCNRGPEPMGSRSACDLQGPSCSAGETCRPSELGSNVGVCDVDANFWWFSSRENCGWCSFYNTEDCCSALSGNVYVDFAREMERRTARADPAIQGNGCQSGMGRTACLLDSICQESFGETLEAIARDLVVTNAFILDPPTENPAGVAVKLSGGRFGDEGRTLTLGQDFVVNEAGTSLEIMGGENLPAGDNERLDIFYVSEIERPAEQVGACGPNP